MKRAYFKDSKKMFKNNLGRFGSIVLIIMLGTAFFIGMNAISPEMEKTAEKYMKDKHIYDYCLESSLGYNKDDLKKFGENEHITEVQGTYSYDALTSFDNKDIVIRVSSVNSATGINKNHIVEGREIKKDNECYISTRLKQMYNYDIGKKIKLYRKDDTNIEDSLKVTEYEIVGIVKNPIYLSTFYGTTELLTGELHSFLFVKEDAFKLDNYTTIYLKSDIDESILKFSEKYKEKNKELLNEIENTNKEIAEEKYNKIYNEYSKNIEDKEAQIKNAEKSLKAYYEEMQKNQLQINHSISTIAFYVSNYYHADNLYNRYQEKENHISKLYTSLNEIKDEKVSLEETNENLLTEINQLNTDINSIQNGMEKNLYEIYNLEHESNKFVELNKKNYQLNYEYNQKNDRYQTLKKQYESNSNKLEENKKNIEEFENNLNTAQEELYISFYSLQDLIKNTGNNSLETQCNQLILWEQNLKNAKDEIRKRNVEEQIKNAKETIKNKKNELNNFKYIEETTPLYESSGFKALKEDLEKMALMGKIFPVVFFVVAALVTITTITRMIEEDRKNIGVFKALGYSKSTIIKRYLIYAFLAGLIGAVLGTIIGSLAIIEILFVSYGDMYDLPDLSNKFNALYILISFIVSLISTVFVTWVVTRKALKEKTADLLRPQLGTKGKEILLEKIPFIWNRLSFLYKICFRNIFRYKRRLLMTLIGIAGCTALIYTGLGLQSAVTSIGNIQFSKVRPLSIEVYLNGELDAKEIETVENDINKKQLIKESTPVRQQSITVKANDYSKDVFYIAISSNEIGKYMNLKERKTQKEIKLDDEGVVLTEKLALLLGVKVGEKITIKDEGTEATLKVTGITENYLYNYIFLTPKVYERVYESKIKYNEIFVNTSKEPSKNEEIDISNELKENDKIASMSFNKNLEKEFKTSLSSLMLIVILFIGCASLLSFSVLVNLNNINIEERKRELSTIKLLGFYEKELESYVFRENIILTILGTLLGLVLGMSILSVIIQAAEVETIFLVKDINYFNLVISIVITICFTLITNFMMKRKIKNINMIDSLKSVE